MSNCDVDHYEMLFGLDDFFLTDPAEVRSEINEGYARCCMRYTTFKRWYTIETVVGQMEA